MKKNFRMMLLGLMVMSSMSTFADVDENARSVNNVLYKLENKGTPVGLVATVVGVNPAASAADVKTISIPATVDGEKNTGYKVVAIADGWQKAAGNKDVSNVTETLIIDAANLADNSLQDFSYLKKLKNLTIKEKSNGKALKDFPKFNDKTIVETLDIAGSVQVTKVPAGAFYGGALKSIKLSNKLFSIGGSAFYGCANLTSFDFGENLEIVNAYAFYGTGLTAADLSKTKVLEIGWGAFQESKVESASLPKTCTKLQGYAFYKTPLATLTLEDAGTLKQIKGYALAYTKLTEFTLIANDPVNEVDIAKSAFEGCTKLKTFNFTGAACDDFDGDGIKDYVNSEAFIGCIAYVTVTAPQEYIDWYGTAPKNCKWEAKAAPVKVDGKIAVKNGFAKWFHNTKTIALDGSKYKAFSVYVDNGGKKKDGTAYFQGLKLENGRYYVQPGNHIILQPIDPAATDVEYEDMTLKTKVISKYSVLIDEIFTLDIDYTLADYQKKYAYGWYNRAADPVSKPAIVSPAWLSPNPSMYIYRLTNNNGIGFSLFTGDTMKGGYDDGTDDNCAKAQFFVQSLRQPDAEGRLNVVWLDADGNVAEGNTTAIEEVKNETEDGVIYNLAGQKVDANYKGVIIKNGKKYMK